MEQDNVEQGMREIAGVRILELKSSGPILKTSRDVSDLIGDAIGQQATLVLLPVSRLDSAFFDLRSGFAGECLQKFVNYGLRLAIVGDISDRTAASSSLRDLIVEANRGTQISFVADQAALVCRLNTVMLQANQQE